MSKLMLGGEFYKAIQNASIDVVETGVYEIKQRLFAAWNETTHEELKELLPVCLHRMYRANAEIEEKNISYYLGFLEGVVTVYSSLFEMEKEEKAIAETIKNSVSRVSEMGYQILDVLYKNGEEWIGHGELAHKVNTSPQSLSNILKRMVMSGAVETAREGNRVKYKLTRPGRKYLEELRIKRSTKENTITQEQLYQAFNYFLEKKHDSIRKSKESDNQVIVYLPNKYKIQTNQDVFGQSTILDWKNMNKHQIRKLNVDTYDLEECFG